MRPRHAGCEAIPAPGQAMTFGAGNVTLSVNRRDAAAYGQWVRWMLGMEFGPGGMNAMHAADRLWAQENAAIKRVAKDLWRIASPIVWGGATTRTVYRGLRLDDPNLDGKLLPRAVAAAYAVPTASYTEDPRVACHFADPGKLGFPAIGVNPTTGQVGLPPHGYIAERTANGREVMFHFKYLLAVGSIFGISDPYVDCPTALAQQEVTLLNAPTDLNRLHAFHTYCTGPGSCGYIEQRYGPGGWQPGPPDPFGPGYVG